MTHGANWAEARAPSLDEFETLAKAAGSYRQFRQHTRTSDLIEFATMKCSTASASGEYDLMGLYQEWSRPQKRDGDHPRDDVVSYATDHDYWADSDETLGHLVTHVLVHEIGHRGLSERTGIVRSAQDRPIASLRGVTTPPKPGQAKVEVSR